MATIVTTTTIRDLALDATFATSDGIVYYLTSCCRASATGTERGTACRGCYRVIDERLGMAWLAADFVAQYPAWASHCGVVEVGGFTFDRYARIIAEELGLATLSI